MTVRRRQLFVADIRELGGLVSVVRSRDRVESAEHFRINFASRGKDLIFISKRIADEPSAIAAAEVLAELTGAKVER